MHKTHVGEGGQFFFLQTRLFWTSLTRMLIPFQLFPRIKIDVKFDELKKIGIELTEIENYANH
jgi:hypothetical protein